MFCLQRVYCSVKNALSHQYLQDLTSTSKNRLQGTDVSPEFLFSILPVIVVQYGIYLILNFLCAQVESIASNLF